MVIHIFNRRFIIYFLFIKLKKETTTIKPVDNVEKKYPYKLLFNLLVVEEKLSHIFKYYICLVINIIR